jgi:hypothetical protein
VRKKECVCVNGINQSDGMYEKEENEVYKRSRRE